MAAGPEEAMDVEGVAPVSCHSGNGAIVDIPVEKNLFGGAITCSFPLRFHDVSDIREVPNNQEVFVDADRDESIIVELLELKENVEDTGSARWFLQDLAMEQESEDSLVVEAESTIAGVDVPNLDATTVINSVVGTMAVAKSRQGPEARNLVRVRLGNIRLRGVETDVLVTFYEPLIISEHSDSAATVGAGATVPARVAGCTPAAEIFKLVLSTFRIHDWSLFGYAHEE